jgi:alpha,alpha-trehalase
MTPFAHLKRPKAASGRPYGAKLRRSLTLLTALTSILKTEPTTASCEEMFVRTQVLNHQVTTTLGDPVIHRAMELKLVDDFKALVDLVPNQLSSADRAQIETRAKQIEKENGEVAGLRFKIQKLYSSKLELLPAPRYLVSPKWTMSPNSPHRNTIDYIEATWEKLARVTPAKTVSSLIPLPFPVMIPGARFQEAYYWDSYFAVHALVGMGRGALVRGQIENFLFMIDNYGLVPNGNRDYYRSRSQPPILAKMTHDYLRLSDGAKLSNANLEWLKNRVLPSLIKDYQDFWMNPSTRFDSATGLNHHYDSQNTPRPERHASDNEAALGKSFRDVRAEAESGKDFTVAFEGEATHFAPVLLNSILYRTERDIADMLRKVGRTQEALEFDRAADRRRTAMNKVMRDSSTGLYYDFHLKNRRRSTVLTADTFAPLWAKVSSGSEARMTALSALQKLEQPGGIISSEVDSGKQWDAPYVWAPHMMFAVEGLRSNGLPEEANRIANNWVSTVDRVHSRTGVILEKYDAVRAEAPIETGDKYVTQQGFLWSNGVYVWLVRDVLGERLIPIQHRQ